MNDINIKDAIGFLIAGALIYLFIKLNRETNEPTFTGL